MSSLQVYYLGEGEASRQWLQQEQNTKAKLCLSHVKAVASHVQARHPATTPLVWDDMLRDIPEDQLSGPDNPIRTTFSVFSHKTAIPLKDILESCRSTEVTRLNQRAATRPWTSGGRGEWGAKGS